MNYVWLLVVSGGAVLLGLVLAFGMIRQDPRRSVGAMIGALVVAVVALVGGMYVARAPTSPIVPPDRQGTDEKLPAAPAQPGALPGASR
jgi:multisubunit Na+/H+ antiporter MnhG subunit